MNSYETIDDLFAGTVDEVLSYGKETSPRGMKVTELRGMTLELISPDRNMLVNRVRKPNYSFMVAEWLWMFQGRRDVRTIAKYNKEIAKFSDDGETFFGAYGPRIVDQLGRVIAILKEDRDSRQAILNIWNPEAIWLKTKDVPCTLTWQFFIREERLEMHVNMRSNDVWLGLPYDIFNFTQFQRFVAAKLGIDVGSYIHHVGSLHIYEQHYEKAWDVVNAPQPSSEFSPVVDARVPVDINTCLTCDFTIEEERAAIESMPANWQEYASLLLYRFTKDKNDLRPFAFNLVGGD